MPEQTDLVDLYFVNKAVKRGALGKRLFEKRSSNRCLPSLLCFRKLNPTEMDESLVELRALHHRVCCVRFGEGGATSVHSPRSFVLTKSDHTRIV